MHYKKPIFLLILLFAAPLLKGQNLTRYVQPMAGTAAATTAAALKHGGGTELYANTIPAVTLPFAMTQWTPQTESSENKCKPPYSYKDSLFSNNKDAGWRFPKGKTEGSVGKVSQIFFSNIKCSSENGVYVSGESVDKISEIYFDPVDLSINKTTTIPGGIYDRRPSNAEGLVKGRTSGFYLDKANHIIIRNSSVTWGNNRPDYFAHLLESHQVTNLKMVNLEGTSAFPGKIDDVANNDTK
jgi:hypothetical protein